MWGGGQYRNKLFTLLRIKIGAKAICDTTQTQPEGVLKGWGNSFYLFDPSLVKLTIINAKLGKQKICVWGTTMGQSCHFQKPFHPFQCNAVK